MNVKKLKTDIWSCIQTGISDTDTGPSTDSPEKKAEGETEKQTGTSTSGSAPLSFQEVVKSVATSTESKQKDASLSFYFISLLHLANEKVSCASVG